ncbi:hypothetical protein Tco_0747085 [Tanacetum coccineum]
MIPQSRSRRCRVLFEDHRCGSPGVVGPPVIARGPVCFTFWLINRPPPSTKLHALPQDDSPGYVSELIRGAGGLMPRDYIPIEEVSIELGPRCKWEAVQPDAAARPIGGRGRGTILRQLTVGGQECEIQRCDSADQMWKRDCRLSDI